MLNIRFRFLTLIAAVAVSLLVPSYLSAQEAVCAIELPQYKKFKGYERALELAVRRIYRELT